jgi:hypothetical protein
MINDLNDLDAVLSQYDLGKALVGPLMNLSINSNFRFFHIAGNGAKVYQSVGLGFIEAETEAERQRGDVVARLQSRFAEVMVLDSQLEMAREANTLWPNEETARFLATAALEAKLQPTQIASRDEAPSGDIGVLPSAQCKPAIDEATEDALTLPDAIDSILTSGFASALAQDLSTVAPHGTPQHVSLPNARETWPLNHDPAVTPPSRCAVLEQDDVALAILRLKLLETSADTETPPPDVDTEAPTATIAIADASADPPAKAAARSASITYRLYAVSGAAALIAGILVIASTRHVAKEASNDRSRTTGSVNVSNPRNQGADVKDTAPQLPAQAAESLRSRTLPVPHPQSATSPGAIARTVPATDEPSPQPPRAVRPQNRVPAPVDATPVSELSAAVSSPAATLAAGPSLQTPESPRAESGTAPPVLTLPSPATQAAGTPVGAAPVLKESRTAPAINAQTVAAAAEPHPQAVELSDAPRPSQAQGGAAVVSEPQTPPPKVTRAEAGKPSVATPELPAAKPARIAKPPLGADELEALLSRSGGFLKNGDFAAARILLRRAAEAGSAEAALMLGKTFDPLYLKELGAMGIQPDVAQARQWYQKAIQLGSEIAAQRLAELTQIRE